MGGSWRGAEPRLSVVDKRKKKWLVAGVGTTVLRILRWYEEAGAGDIAGLVAVEAEPVGTLATNGTQDERRKERG